MTPPPKKSLGQNWLRSETALEAIVSAARLEPSDTVLEIGPGEGGLTARLLGVTKKVIAVEKDQRLLGPLQERFAQEIKSGRLVLIAGDILDLDLADPKLNNYKLVANIPYYITGALLRKFLEAKNQPRLMVVLVQKEVAERIVRSPKESLLSLGVKAYGTPRYIKTVPAGAFRPAPKVDSAILAIENISHRFFDGLNEKKFWSLVHQGFAQKRKMLRGNLGLEKETLSALGFNPNSRAEDLSLADWKHLTQGLKTP